MENIRIPRIVRETSRAHRFKGRSVGFVPTMGSLHQGHLSLVRYAKSENDVVVVSIFVNPTQFGPHEDFAEYPRDMERDLALLERAGVDVVFLPQVDAIYPSGFRTEIRVNEISDKLCGAYRPGHFSGVATVVNKLFNIVQPNRAYFGQKDFQQTIVIRRMVEDLNMDVELVVCPTLRAEGGLAMSSRNAYLGESERTSATILFRALTQAVAAIRQGGTTPMAVTKTMHEVLATEPLVTEVQYAGVYHTKTLDALTEFQKANLLAISLKLGNTRLIDNMLVEL
ncbi:MAG TPA: pantoate--beta-alanine ligase [Dissulfurispiraceae bacterium]|nr:pantoate--beta-alanine ligase [Dissulfurispiraceae bacterium]